ncbi:MAG: ribosome biogenesis GTPase Der [Candidatus Komeilibacteria bacterium]
MNLPQVAIVGRANVGKSTLFNKLTDHNKALVSPVAGTTRDRLTGECQWRDRTFTVIDTGGFDVNKTDVIEAAIWEQTDKAIRSADLILFMVNINEGLMPADIEFTHYLKKINKPVLLIANQADNLKKRQLIAEFYKLGFGDPLPISAINSSGTGDMLDELIKQLPTPKKKTKPTIIEQDAPRPIKLIFIGQPNVGKSSLINAILDEDRVIATPIAHTTRGVQTIDFTYQGTPFQLLDTAGLRRNKSRTNIVEKFSLEQIDKVLPSADVALLVTDVSQRLTVQDKKITDLIDKSGVNLVLVANKWDLIPDKDEKTINKYVDYYNSFMPSVRYAPIIFTSATERQRVHKLLELAQQTYQERFKSITDNACQKFLKKAIKKNLPQRGKGTRHPYILDLRQKAVNPPYFELRLDGKSELAGAYVKYLSKELRAKFGFSGTPIRIKIIKVDLSHKDKKIYQKALLENINKEAE